METPNDDLHDSDAAYDDGTDNGVLAGVEVECIEEPDVLDDFYGEDGDHLYWLSEDHVREMCATNYDNNAKFPPP